MKGGAISKTVPIFRPSVRYTNGLVIWFKSKCLVQVRDKDAVVNFSRYGQPGKGTYQESWQPFCEKLRRLNGLKTIWEVMDLAQRYDIDMTSPWHKLEPIPEDILVRPSIYKPQRRSYEKK